MCVYLGSPKLVAPLSEPSQSNGMENINVQTGCVRSNYVCIHPPQRCKPFCAEIQACKVVDRIALESLAFDKLAAKRIEIMQTKSGPVLVSFPDPELGLRLYLFGNISVQLDYVCSMGCV